MKIVIQRVKSAHVVVDEQTVGQVEQGLVLLVGIEEHDTEENLRIAAQKIMNMRIFDDTKGVMNCSLLDVDGAVLSISQFTLAADIRKGNRPSYSKAMKAAQADEYYRIFNDHLRAADVDVQTGIFQAHMNVQSDNDGPVTIIMIVKDGKVLTID